MRNRYAALSPHHPVKRPIREEATGTPADHPASDEPSIILIRVSSIIVLTLRTESRKESYTLLPMREPPSFLSRLKVHFTRLQRLLRGDSELDESASTELKVIDASTWGPVLAIRALFDQLGLWDILN